MPPLPQRRPPRWLPALLAPGLAAGCEGSPPAPVAAPSAAGSVAAPTAEAPPRPRLVDARGPDRVLPPRPPDASRLCSATRPVCVHGPAGAAGEVLLAAEAALNGLVALRLPAPTPDLDRGGGPELDLYLDPELVEPRVIPDLALDHRTWDAAPAFVLAPAALDRGCAGRAAIARAIAAASLLGRDAGAEELLLGAASTYLAWLVAPCDVTEQAAVDAFQRSPERGLDRAPTLVDGEALGGALFFAFLEERFGSGRPGELTTALFAAAPQRTAPASPRFQNEPDVVDVLVDNARAGGSPPFGELLRDFSVARAFLGSRSDDQHLRDVTRFGEGGRVRFDWSVPYASLPRSLAPARPLLPTGASYTWIDLREAPGGSALTLVARWEPPVQMRWAVVKVGPEGEERGRVEPPAVLGATSVQQSLVDLHGLAGLVVVAVNEGGSSAIDTYDPDDGPHAGQSFTLELHAE